jgi:TonB family protein
MRIRLILIVSLLTMILLGTVQHRPVQADPAPTCPVSFDPMQLIGITADQQLRQYRIKVHTNIEGRTRLLLAPIDSNLGVMPRIATESFDPANAHVTMTVWSDRPLEGFKLLSVIRPDSGDVECATQSMLGDSSHADSRVTVFAHGPSPAEGVSLTTSVYSDSVFVYRAIPEYPLVAVRQNQTGTAVVDITVSTAGSPQRVRLFRSSNTPLLDASALAAARNSTFKAATNNDVPESTDYLVDYVFKIEGLPDEDTCGIPLAVHLTSVPGLPGGKLFDLAGYPVNNSSILAATFSFSTDLSQTGTIVTLPNIAANNDEPQSAFDRRPPSKDTSLLWIGPQVDYVGLQSTVGPDGALHPCHGAGVRALDSDGGPIVVDPKSPSDPLPAATWLVEPARYESRVFPVYPKAEATSGHKGCAKLLVHVTPNSGVDNVWVLDSTGYDALDAAAIRAARTSSYQLLSLKDASPVQYYTSTYCFDPS